MKVLACIGLLVVVLIACVTIKGLFSFIQRVIVGKYKIKCICKHEYIPYSKWYAGKHGIEYEFVCRKCNKKKVFKTYQSSKEESVF